MLDAAASGGAERAADVAENVFRERLRDCGRLAAGKTTQRHCPGYCGWHVSGQGALFHALRPEEIGISLNASWLMQPLKSVSGVILAGPVAGFRFDNTFPFCATCATHSCRQRIEALPH
jgi:hypothetical protein